MIPQGPREVAVKKTVEALAAATMASDDLAEGGPRHLRGRLLYMALSHPLGRSCVDEKILPKPGNSTFRTLI